MNRTWLGSVLLIAGSLAAQGGLDQAAARARSAWLAHDPRARIVWAHVGWDRTGHRTPELCRRLLRSHPNLYMDVKLDPGSPGKNRLLLPGPRPTVHPEWLQLFRDFPDRFVMGSDQHYPEPATGPQRWEAIAALLRALPPDVQRKMGTENANRLLSRETR